MKAASYQWGGLSGSTGQNQGAVSARNSVSGKDKNQKTNSIRRPNQNKRPPKHLNYNSREIRNALAPVRDSQSAGRVLCQARSKLSSLLRCKGTGMYNETELSNAIGHARRMVRCAQLKNRNLKKEEDLQKRYAKQEEAQEQRQKREIKSKIQRKKRVLEQQIKMEKMQNMRRKKQHEEELIRRRRMNRLAEKSEMDEADMEYKYNMNRNTDRTDCHRNPESFYLPVEGAELELSEEAMMQSEEQMEQQLEMMLQAELATAALSVAPDQAVAAMPDMASAEGAVAEGAVTIDVVV